MRKERKSVSCVRSVRATCVIHLPFISVLSFAPGPEETDGESAVPGPRECNRGQRSPAAKIARQLRRRHAVAESTCQLHDESFSVLHMNVQGLLSSVDELAGYILLMKTRPSILCLNETFLDDSIGDVPIEGYTLISRLDRRDGRSCGGIAVYALHSLASRITCVFHSKAHERTWMLIHTDRGAYLLGSWYRPPGREVESIADLKTEILEHCRYALGVILVGDMNVHERSWLKYSNGISAEGRKLHEVSADLGLRQLVHAPTRGDYLLDLVLSNLEDVTCTVTPKIADHNGVVVKLKLSVPTSCSVKRTVWSFNKADWEQVFSALESKDWSFLESLSVDDCAERLTDSILE